ncbi:MAG: hypothetical protein VX589_02105 [Myxococcota bacterium]|nr:hypothetical protein [Myxococcota bacterium]
MTRLTILLLAGVFCSTGCQLSLDGRDDGMSASNNAGGASTATPDEDAQPANANGTRASTVFRNLFGTVSSAGDANRVDGASASDDGRGADNDGESGAQSIDTDLDTSVQDDTVSVISAKCAELCPRVVACLDTVCGLDPTENDRAELVDQCAAVCVSAMPPEAVFDGLEDSLSNGCGGLQVASNDICSDLQATGENGTAVRDEADDSTEADSRDSNEAESDASTEAESEDSTEADSDDGSASESSDRGESESDDRTESESDDNDDAQTGETEGESMPDADTPPEVTQCAALCGLIEGLAEGENDAILECIYELAPEDEQDCRWSTGDREQCIACLAFSEAECDAIIACSGL